MIEEWRNFRGVKVSNNKKCIGKKGKQVSATKYGYPVVIIEGRKWKVHTVVWIAFNGEIPKGFEINHKDGDKANYSLDNLELATHQQNMQHMWDTGLRKIMPKPPIPRHGENHPCSKLTNNDVLTIRSIGSSMSQRALARMYNTTQTNVRYILERRIWKTI